MTNDATSSSPPGGEVTAGHGDALESSRVIIVSCNPETLDGLQVYLRHAGVDAAGTDEVETKASRQPGLTAMVLFPDEFPAGTVLREVSRLRRERPSLLIILVTREPTLFARSLDARDGAETVIVPKPAWGWAILDAIRDHAERRQRQRSDIPDRR